MNTSIQIPLTELPLNDGYDESAQDGEPAESGTGELLLGLLLGLGALVAVHVVWQIAMLCLQLFGLLP